MVHSTKKLNHIITINLSKNKHNNVTTINTLVFESIFMLDDHPQTRSSLQLHTWSISFKFWSLQSYDKPYKHSIQMFSLNPSIKSSFQMLSLNRIIKILWLELIKMEKLLFQY